MRYLKVEPPQISHFFEKCNDLSVKVDSQLVRVSKSSNALHLEQPTGDGNVLACNVLEPHVEYGFRVQLLAKIRAVSLQLLAFGMQMPIRSQNVFYLSHI